MPYFPSKTSSGGVNTVQVTVDFGFTVSQEGDTARITVTGQPWVTPSSIILCNPVAASTVDHDLDDVTVEGIVAYAQNLVGGIGFDVVAYAPQNSFGKYVINAMGI